MKPKERNEKKYQKQCVVVYNCSNHIYNIYCFLSPAKNYAVQCAHFFSMCECVNLGQVSARQSAILIPTWGVDDTENLYRRYDTDTARKMYRRCDTVTAQKMYLRYDIDTFSLLFRKNSIGVLLSD